MGTCHKAHDALHTDKLPAAIGDISFYDAAGRAQGVKTNKEDAE